MRSEEPATTAGIWRCISGLHGIIVRAAYLLAPRQVEMREVERPDAPRGGLLVRVRAALTDGTDLKAYRRGHPQMPMPTRFGHEFSGDVVAVGNGVRTFSTSDAVMSVHSAPCGQCFWCQSAQEELCRSIMSTKILGAYADYVAIPEHIVRRNVFKKPASLSYIAAAFLEPLSCVVHSLSLLAPRAKSCLAILGDGGFGLLHVLLARARGHKPVVVGRREERLALARRLGFKHVLSANENVGGYIGKLTEGRGADGVIECTGTAQAWERAPDYVRRGGTVSFFGGLPQAVRVAFSAARMHYDEVRFISPFHYTTAAVREARDLLVSGILDVERLVSRCFSLDEIGEAFVELDRGNGIKYAIEP